MLNHNIGIELHGVNTGGPSRHRDNHELCPGAYLAGRVVQCRATTIPAVTVTDPKCRAMRGTYADSGSFLW